MSPDTAPTPGPSPNLGGGERTGGAVCSPFPLTVGGKGVGGVGGRQLDSALFTIVIARSISSVVL